MTLTPTESLNRLKELINNARLPKYSYEFMMLLIEKIETDIELLKLQAKGGKA